MGGLLILAASLVPTLLWADLTNAYVWIAVLADRGLRRDRVRRRLPEDRAALASRAAAPLQDGLADRHRARASASRCCGWPRDDLYNTRLIFPFFKRADSGSRAGSTCRSPSFVLVGVDQRGEPDRRPRRAGDQRVRRRGGGVHGAGLRHRPPRVRRYLQLVRLRAGRGELTIFCGSLVGASLGFLWYNSLSRRHLHGRRRIAGAGRRARHGRASSSSRSCCWSIVGGVFVLEALSVIIQVALVQAHRASASSGWRRSTTTSSSSAGANRK